MWFGGAFAPILESTKFHVLLALAEGPTHGAAVRKRIIGDTLGAYLRDSLLYSVLDAMDRDGLIERLETPGQPRRRVYRLTERGRHRLEVESRRLRRAAELSQQRLGWR